MAIYHSSVSIIKRSAGRSAVAAAAYRSGGKLTDERTGIIHDYTRKSGVDKSIILTPINADWITDRQQLWNRVEAAERRCDARLAKEITLAIPVELSRDDKIALVSEYIQKNFVDSGMIADINFHGLVVCGLNKPTILNSTSNDDNQVAILWLFAPPSTR